MPDGSFMPERTVFFVSDGTGITAETFGNSMLAQFLPEAAPGAPALHRHVEKAARQVAPRSTRGPCARASGRSSSARWCANTRSTIVRSSKGLVLDMFRTFVEPLERSSASRATTASAASPTPARVRVQRPHRGDQLQRWRTTTASRTQPRQADVILVGVSRSGKTPTSLYLAMQHGIKAANYPLIPDDFERGRLPSTLAVRTSASASA
jgi:[pyruvate, water dikinase]-phosphate phosphotransferase / [pyruvate, water dikinase] kinase